MSPLLRPLSNRALSRSKIQSTVDLHGKKEFSRLPQQGGHNRDATGCITHAAPASRVHHLHHDESPASDLNHLHQPCITCINPASRAKGCINPASQPRTGCITRTRKLGKPKHQAPSTQVTRNRPYARCPLALPAAPPKHRNGRRGHPASAHARTRAHARARAPATARARACA